MNNEEVLSLIKEILFCLCLAWTFYFVGWKLPRWLDEIEARINGIYLLKDFRFDQVEHDEKMSIARRFMGLKND